MTMAEFNIRLFSFKRVNDRQDMLFREVAYYSMIGSHLNPKKLPKTKQQFWSLGYEKKIDKDKLDIMRKEMLKVSQAYKNRNKK